MAYYLGLDYGGTFIKASVLDEAGKRIAISYRKVNLLVPETDMAEQSMEQLWRDTCSMIREVMVEAGVRINALSFSGHGKGLYLADAQGKPCGNGVLSSDNRAFQYVKQWECDGTAEKMYKKTAQGLKACQPICLLKWFSEHKPEQVKGARWILGVKDYIRLRLTGEAKGELTDFSGSGLVNIYTAQYDDGLLKLADLNWIREKLPPLIQSTKTAGTVTKKAAEETGLLEGTICAAGLFDIDACAVSMGIFDEKKVGVVAGTWGIHEYLTKIPVTDGSAAMNSLYCQPGWYLAEESSPTSASNLEWFLQCILPDAEKEMRYDKAMKMASHVSLQQSRPLYFPFIYGNGKQQHAHAVFLGMTADMKAPELIRSVMEGVIFYHKYQLESLLKNGDNTKGICLAGGICHSDLWLQLFADILEAPVTVSGTEEAGLMGAAMTAAIAEGRYKNYGQAAAAMTKKGKLIVPNPEHSASYRDTYQGFKKHLKQLQFV